MTTFDKQSTITIGVIARNGLPFLTECLSSLPEDGDFEECLHFILVDCVSEDLTCKAMVDFATTRKFARVFRISGTANSAVARNVILKNAMSGFIMLLDGDVRLSHDFLKAGIERIRKGEADAVIGSLREIRHDENNDPLGATVWRHQVLREQSLWLTSSILGLILLGPQLASCNILYDETFRRNQDRDFAIRLNEVCKIIQIPISMGVHLTHAYFSPMRIKKFIGEMYSRPTGFLIRKHAMHPWRLLWIIKMEKGPFLGLFLQILIFISLISGQFRFVAIITLLVALDYARFVLQKRSHEYLLLRLITPWIILYGIFGPKEPHPQYQVSRVV